MLPGVFETIAGRAVAEAVKPLVDRFQLTLGRRGYGASNIFVILERERTPRSADVTGIKHLWELPAGTTIRDVQQVLGSDEFHAICRELTAVSVFGGAEANLGRVRRRLLQLTSAKLSTKAASPESLDALVGSIFDEMRDLCKRVADELIRSVKAPAEVLTWANNVVLGDVLYSIEAKLTSPETDYSIMKKAWIDDYLTAFKDRHRNIDIPDFTSRRHAPFSDLFVPPRLSELPIRLPDLTKASEKLPEARETSFSRFVSRIDRCVVLGDPGAGKSTSSTIAALQCIKRGKVPFIITLRSVKSPSFDLSEYLSALLAAKYQCVATAKEVRSILESGKALIVFDGLDEILHNSDRVEMTKTVEAIAKRYPFVSILVTCRRIGYAIARLDSQRFTEYLVQPMNTEQVADYAKRWFRLQAEHPTAIAESEKLAQDFTESARTMADLVENPLLLSFICVLYRGRRSIPRTRPDLYRRCVELLLEWDDIRRISETSHDIDVALIALSRIAYIDDGSGLSASEIESDLVPFLTEHSTGVQRESDRIIKQLLRVCRGRAWLFTDVGLNAALEDLFSFTHASFREYLAALYEVRHSPSAIDLARHLYPSLTNGSAQIYIQICLWLYDARVHAGASLVLQELCDLVQKNNPAVDRPGMRIQESKAALAADRTRRAVAIRSIAEAADCVGLSRAAAGSIIRLAIDQIRQGDVLSALSLLDEDYRHGLAAREALLENVNELRTATDLLEVRALWFCLHMGSISIADDVRAAIPWSFVTTVRAAIRSNESLIRNLSTRGGIFEVIAVESGSLPVSYYAHVPCEMVFAQIFTRHGTPLALGPETIVDWLLDCFSSSERRRNRVPSATGVLRMIAWKVETEGQLPRNVPLPQFSQYIDWHDHRLGIALDRIQGFPAACRDGLAFVAAALFSLQKLVLPNSIRTVSIGSVAATSRGRAIIQEWISRKEDFWISDDLG